MRILTQMVSYFLLKFYTPLLFCLGDDKKLEDMVKELSNALTSVKQSQVFMEAREKVHHSSKKCFVLYTQSYWFLLFDSSDLFFGLEEYYWP